MTTPAEVTEGVRAAIALYTHALDDGRADDVVATFCPDGSVDIPGLGAHDGHDALRAVFHGYAPRVPVRHVVCNTLVVEWSEQEARATTDLVVLVKRDTGWSIQAVGRYDDTLHRADDGTWRFHRRTAEFVE
jgi:hypothetical protein